MNKDELIEQIKETQKKLTAMLEGLEDLKEDPRRDLSSLENGEDGIYYLGDWFVFVHLPDHPIYYLHSSSIAWDEGPGKNTKVKNSFKHYERAIKLDTNAVFDKLMELVDES